MANFCPNINSEEFKSLEKAVGTNAAYKIWEQNKGFSPRYTPTGEESALFNRLLKETGSVEKAMAVKAFAYTDSFLEKYGDWTSGKAKSGYVDSRGEPNMHFINGSVQIEKIVKPKSTNKYETMMRHKRRVEAFLNGEDLIITKEHIKNYFRAYGIVSPNQFKNTGVYTINRTPKGERKGNNKELYKNSRQVLKVIDKFIDRLGYSPISFVTEYGSGVIYEEDLIEQMNDSVIRKGANLGTIMKDLQDIKMPQGEQTTMFRKDYSVSSMKRETADTGRRKIEFIKNKIKDITDVEFIEDETIEESGKLLPSSHPLSKQYGKPVIVINPNKLFEDTVFHEVGHLLIELAGGLSNARIRAAIDKLRGTSLYEEVSNEYTEYKGERLDKEVLATALGIDATKLFSSEFKQNWWRNFLDWFYGIIGKKTNTSPTSIRSLTEQLYEGNFVVKNTDIEFTEFMKRNMKAEDRAFIEDIQKEKSSLESLYKDAVERINVKIRILKSKKNPNKDFIKQLEKLKKEMEQGSKISFANGLYKFVENANIFLSIKNTELANVDWTDQRAEAYSKRFNDIYLHNLQGYLGTYNMIPAIIEKLKADKDFVLPFEELDKRETDPTKKVNKKKLISYLESVHSKFHQLQNNLDHHIRQKAIFNLASNSNYSQGKAKRAYEREANALYANITDKKQKAELKRKYINDKMAENKENFFKQNLEYYTNLFEDGLHDLPTLSAYLSDAQGMNSLVVQIFDKIIDEADFNTRVFTQGMRHSYYELFESLEGHSSNGLEFYKNILDFDSDGKPTGFLKGEYKAEIYIQYMEMFKKYRRLANEYGEDSDELNAYIKDEYMPFIDENFDEGPDGKMRPIPKWETGFKVENLSEQDRKLYKFFKTRISDSDLKLRKSDRLTKVTPFGEFFMIPVIGKQNMYELGYGGVAENVKGVYNNMFKRQGDDEGLVVGEVEGSKNILGMLKTFADEANREILNAPVYFRSRENINPQQQSYDLLSVFMMNDVMAENHKNKSAILPSLNILIDAVASEQTKFFEKKRGKLLVNANRSDNKPISKEGKESNTYKVLNSILQDRILGMSSIYAGEIFGMDTNKVMSSIAGWTAGTMLGLNYMAASVNILQGTLNNWIYNASRGDITKEDWMKGEKLFWQDLGGWTNDIGKIKHNSKTHLIAEKLNVFSDFKALYNSFSENNMFKTMLKRDKIFFLNHAGEFYMQSTLMYVLLSKIKVLNAQGKFIDKDGNVVKTEKEAASLADMYTVKDGVAVLSDKVKYTTFDTVNEVSEVAISNYIKDVLADLHGQYDKNKQSMFQRTFYGKMLIMLRKWLVRGVERRWRGVSTYKKSYDELDPSEEFYSESTMEFKEGTYTAMLRFLHQVKSSLDELSFKLAFQTNWNSLTDVEKSYIRQSILELSLIVLAWGSSWLLYALAKDADDDEKAAIFMMTFLIRRLYSETAFYANPFEWLQILRTPAASLSFLEQISDVLTQLMNPLEEYERGPRKGTYKLYKEFGDVVPVMNQLNKNIEHSTEYIFSGI